MTVSDILCSAAVGHFSEITAAVPPYTHRMQLSVTVTSNTTDISLTQSNQSRCQSHTASCSKGTRGSVPGYIAGRVETDH